MSGKLITKDAGLPSWPKSRVLRAFGTKQQDQVIVAVTDGSSHVWLKSTDRSRMGLQIPQPSRVEGQHLLKLLKMPSALAGRMAVAEASLLRLHGSPDTQQPRRAGAGAPAAQQPTSMPAAETPGTVWVPAGEPGQAPSTAWPTAHAASEHGRGQYSAKACRCAGNDSIPAGGQCLFEPFLGKESTDRCLWQDSFRMLLRITGAEQDSQHREDQEGFSKAQQCSALAQELRRVISGLPVSHLGAATVTMTAFMAVEIVCREISPDVSIYC